MKQVKARTAICSEIGAAKGRASPSVSSVRLPIRLGHSLEPQKRAARAFRKLEPIPLDRGYRFRRADGSTRFVFPCNRAVAGRRQPRRLSWPTHQPQRHVQPEYVPPRFLVVGEAMAERSRRRASGQFAGQDFYGSQHYAASFIFEDDGIRVRQFVTDFESFDPPVNTGGGNAHCPQSQPLCEIDGGGGGPRALCS